MPAPKAAPEKMRTPSNAAYSLFASDGELHQCSFCHAHQPGGFGRAIGHDLPLSTSLRNARSESGYFHLTAFHFHCRHCDRHQYQPANRSDICAGLHFRNAAGGDSTGGAPPKERQLKPEINGHRDTAIRADGLGVLWMCQHDVKPQLRNYPWSLQPDGHGHRWNSAALRSTYAHGAVIAPEKELC